MHSDTRYSWRTTFLFLAITLSACNGGGSDSAPAADTEGLAEKANFNAVSLAFNHMEFSWSPVEGAESYRVLMRDNRQSGYRELTTTNSQTLTYNTRIFTPAAALAEFALDVCDAAGCKTTPSISAPQDLNKSITFLKMANTSPGDQLGLAVAVSGNGEVVAVASPLEDSKATGVNGNPNDESASNTGAVYVYRLIDRQWEQTHYIKSTISDPESRFGLSLDLDHSGNTLVVGAPNEDNYRTDSGAVYIYDLAEASASPTLLRIPLAQPPTVYSHVEFGSAVSISGDGQTLAISAPEENGAGVGATGDPTACCNNMSGAVYIYSKKSGSWSQSVYLKSPNPEAGDRLGQSIALDFTGETLVAGAASEDSGADAVNGNQSDNSATSAGAAYVFRKVADNWTFDAYLKAKHSDEHDAFGAVVGISDDGGTVAISAPRENGGQGGVNGEQTNNDSLASGAVYIFANDAGQWRQQAYLKSPMPEYEDWFGSAIALNGKGDSLAVVSQLEDGAGQGLFADYRDNTATNAGAIFLYTLHNKTWAYMSYIKTPNAESNDHVSSVALSSEGTVMVVGATGEDSAATGIGGDQSSNSTEGAGAAYIY